MSSYNSRTLIALIIPLLVTSSGLTFAQTLRTDVVSYDSVARRILETGLRDLEAFSMLQELTSTAGHRLSGSPGAEKAVELTRQMMVSHGFDNVHLEAVMVPHWVRGPIEQATVVKTLAREAFPLTVCALGGSIATPPDGIEGEVVEVKSFDELKSLGANVRGKIVFYNRPFDRTKVNTFEAYGGAVDQRSRGAIEAARVGAVAALVRSMTQALDDVPHTGMMNYADTVRKVPAAAVSTLDADSLSTLIKREKTVRVNLKLTCQILPDVQSANVVGQITGSEKPDEVIVVGGHLDC